MCPEDAEAHRKDIIDERFLAALGTLKRRQGSKDPPLPGAAAKLRTR